MPLFGSKKKNDFSGRPDVEDPAYPNRSSTLHKRNAGNDPIDTRTTQPTYGEPGYGQTGTGQPGYNTAGPTSATAANEIDARKINDTPSSVGRKKTRGGLFGRRRRTSSHSSSSDEGRYVSPQTTGTGTFGSTAGTMHGQQHAGTNGFSGNTMSNGLQPYTGDDMGTAREKVHAAEAAEREALRMLGAARAAVKEAKEHIDRLALQADEEARRAGMKQKEAQALRNDTRNLGRHI